VGLVGPNGAGKTTTFNLISGFERASAGRIVFDGHDVTGLPPHVLARRGLLRTFQQTTLFAQLSVDANIRIGCFRRMPGGLRRTLLGTSRAEQAAVEHALHAIVELTGLGPMRARAADELAYGNQRVLEIAIALGAAPRLLLLDEPFAGMNPGEAEACMALIHRVREGGVTIVLVDHHMDTLTRHCDRIVVMHHGEKLAEGRPEEIQRDARVIATYLGTDDDV
jgi:ABC-type branched-subunit amino acid transport system ATPase component